MAVIEKQRTKLSLRNFDWKLKEHSSRESLYLSQKFNLSNILASIITSRVNNEDYINFVNPSLKNTMKNPFFILDMEKGVNRVINAINNNQKIAVFGDYDVDGATSSALLKNYFRILNIDLRIYIPDRAKEGYGPNKDAFKKLKEEKIDLVITVDCGTASLDVIEYANEIGLDVIIIDHHLSGEILPDACAVINPNRLDEKTEYTYLAAVGVAFVFLVALNSRLRALDYFGDAAEPNLIDFLDIVALGTVCDVVPLVGLNRSLVKQGLKVIKKRSNPGIASLIDVAGINEEPSTYHLGFIIGPRINAGGRVGESYLGSEILSSKDTTKIHAIAQSLDKYNQQRKAIESQVLDEAELQAELQKEHGFIFVHGENWHQGVIGIVAGRLKEKYNKPTIVISFDGDIGKSSCRSISGIDLGSIIVSAKQLDILVAGGGHAMAAGFTVEMNQLNKLKEFLAKKIKEQIEKADNLNEKYFDAYIALGAVNNNLVNELSILSPFGQGNPEPKFMIKNVSLFNEKIVGEAHISCLISCNDNSARSIKGTIFRSVNTDLGDFVLKKTAKNVNIIGKAKINNWLGRANIEFHIEDIVLNN